MTKQASILTFQNGDGVPNICIPAMGVHGGSRHGAHSVVKKATTGYAGGHKEFHLWIEKENLR